MQIDKPVLIVIDMCQDFFLEGRLFELRKTLLRSTNELVAHFRKFGFPIIWIRQEFEADLSDAFLSMRKAGIKKTIKGTGGELLLPELDVKADDIEIIKKRYSAFFGTRLDEILKSLKASHLVLAGVNTHACIRTTAVDGYQRDFEVIVAESCVNSYDESFHEDSKRYLNGRIATFLQNETIFERFWKGNESKN